MGGGSKIMGGGGCLHNLVMPFMNNIFIAKNEHF